MMTTVFKWIIVLAVGISSTTHAQLVRGFGIKVGVTAANQTWDYASVPDLTADNRWGITGSAFVELLRMPYFSVLVESQYTQKGMSFSAPVATEQNPDGTGEFITLRPRVDYLSTPILAKVRLETPLITPYLLAGPRYDVLLARHGEGFQAVIDKFKSSELGATIGGGAEFGSLLPLDVLIELRYNMSLQAAYNTNFLKVRNQTLDLMLGVRL
jgi:hypothetical protein